MRDSRDRTVRAVPHGGILRPDVPAGGLAGAQAAAWRARRHGCCSSSSACSAAPSLSCRASGGGSARGASDGGGSGAGCSDVAGRASSLSSARGPRGHGAAAAAALSLALRALTRRPSRASTGISTRTSYHGPPPFMTTRPPPTAARRARVHNACVCVCVWGGGGGSRAHDEASHASPQQRRDLAPNRPRAHTHETHEQRPEPLDAVIELGAEGGGGCVGWA